jgi:hypothetical protein
MAANIIKRLERYLIGVIDSPESSKKEKATAARQLIDLRMVKVRPKPKQVAVNTVLGSKASE